MAEGLCSVSNSNTFAVSYSIALIMSSNETRVLDANCIHVCALSLHFRVHLAISYGTVQVSLRANRTGQHTVQTEHVSVNDRVVDEREWIFSNQSTSVFGFSYREGATESLGEG